MENLLVESILLDLHLESMISGFFSHRCNPQILSVIYPSTKWGHQEKGKANCQGWLGDPIWFPLKRCRTCGLYPLRLRQEANDACFTNGSVTINWDKQQGGLLTGGGRSFILQFFQFLSHPPSSHDLLSLHLLLHSHNDTMAHNKQQGWLFTGGGRYFILPYLQFLSDVLSSHLHYYYPSFFVHMTIQQQNSQWHNRQQQDLGWAFRPEFRFLPVLIFRNSGYSAEFQEFRGTRRN